jgi:predicted PurR-regulated permease PerM
MKKIIFDKHYLRAALYAFFTVAALIVLEKALGNIAGLGGGIGSGIRFLTRVLAPFLYGAVFAYFINCPVVFIESQYAKIKGFAAKPKRLRFTSLVTVYGIIIVILFWVLTFLIPEISASILHLIDNIVTFTQAFDSGDAPLALGMSSVQEFLESINSMFNTTLSVDSFIHMALDPLVAVLASLPNVITAVLTGTLNFAWALFNFIMGFIISIFLLFEKDNMAAFCAKLSRIIFKQRRADMLADFARGANITFSGFIVGKSIESFIIGTIFFIIAMIMDLPYPLLLTLIVGVTNMIPFFGSWIGGIIAVFIVLLFSPLQAFGLAIAILILQQIDGLIIGPAILGDRLKIKPIGVIFSVFVGGAMFGIPGMFFGTPVFAVLSHTINTYVDRKHSEKQIAYGLPDAPIKEDEKKGED